MNALNMQDECIKYARYYFLTADQLTRYCGNI